MDKNIGNLTKKSRSVKRKVGSAVMCSKPIQTLYRNRRAVSAVISNLILVAAVIVVGFAVLAYVRSTATDYQTEYQLTVNSDIDKLKETLAFEYVHYDGTAKVLDIYFMNAGEINVELDKVYLSTSPENLPFDIYDLSNPPQQTNYFLGMGNERHIVLHNIDSLESGQTYTVKLETVRGLTFASNFAV